MLHQVQLWCFRPFTPASLCLMSCRLRPRRDDSEDQRLCTANTSVTGKVPNPKSLNSKRFNESEHLVALKCVTGTRRQHSYQAVTCAVIIQVTNVVPAT